MSSYYPHIKIIFLFSWHEFLLSSCWVLVELFVFQWSRAIIMTSRYIFFFSETWDVENCSGFLVEMFPFQWSRARDHVDRIQFRDRAIWSGFCTCFRISTCYGIRQIHATEYGGNRIGRIAYIFDQQGLCRCEFVDVRGISDFLYIWGCVLDFCYSIG